jgi:hypothetical protein
MDDSLQKYRTDKQIIRLTVEQLKKDFGSALTGEILLSGNDETAFEEIKNQLIPVLKSLTKTNKILLNALLYKIDIKMTDISSLSPAEMAEKIIQREFQKILIRRYFSS